MNELIAEIKSYLLKWRIIFEKAIIDYSNKTITKGSNVVFINEIQSLKHKSYEVRNYALLTFVIVAPIAFISALIYNIYIVENTFGHMDPHQLMILNQLAILRGGQISDGIYKIYEYDAFFLFFGPLFNALAWSIPLMLVARLIKKPVKQYEVTSKTGTLNVVLSNKDHERISNLIGHKDNEKGSLNNRKVAEQTSYEDQFELMKRYKEMLDSGIMTQAEFDKKKSQILKL
jgi:hypothetical protein